MNGWRPIASNATKKTLGYWLLIAVMSGVVLFYLWTAAAPSRNFDPQNNILNYYNRLTDAFLAGQFHLVTPPTPEILALADPYEDEALKVKWGLWDASLYKGKYYLYFGISPVITLYLPYRLLAGLPLSDYLASLIYCAGGFLWSSLLLIFLRERYFRGAPLWMLAIAVSVLGFANAAPFMLRRLAQYQVAISCGYFFLMGGLYWLIRASQDVKVGWRYWVGSLFLGVAVGARPNFAVAASVALIVTGFTLVRHGAISKTGAVRTIAGLMVPFGTCLALLGLYNYVRFGSPFEFGHRYILTVANYTQSSAFGFENVLPNLYFYLLHRPAINSTFPFLHLNTLHHPLTTLPPIFYIEKVAGIFFTVPYLLVGSLGVVSHRWLSLSTAALRNSPTLTLASYLVLMVGLINFAVLMLFHSPNMRYSTDFISLFILSASLAWFRADSVLISRPALQRIIRIAALVLAAISIMNGAAFGIEGTDYDQRLGLAGQDPETYEKLVSFFEPVSRFLSRSK